MAVLQALPVPVPARLTDLAAYHAARHPGAIALRFEGRSIRYASLHQRQLALAAWLHQQGVVAGDRVAWLGLNHADQVALLLALAQVGAVLVPLNFRLAPPEWDAVLADCTPRWVLHDAHWQDAAQALAQRHGLAAHAVQALDGNAADAPAAGDDETRPVLLVYTSGTTGAPKGVQTSRRAVAADIDALAAAWQWSAEDTLVHGLPLFHVHGLVLGLLGSLRIGNRFVHTGKPAPEAYARAGGTLYFGVPTVWSRVAADPDSARALRGARLLVSGSAALPVPVFDGLMALTGHAPVERYGSTESLITLSTLAGGERRPGWVGLPLAGVETRLVDETGAAVPHDGETIGRLEVRGPMMFDGYLNRAEATAEVLGADGWYHTGDVAVLDGGGMHRIVGRESVDLIKSGGYRVGAGEVETALLGHPGVSEVAVVGLPDDDLGQRIVAFVVGDADPDELIGHVAEQLSVHKRPREVRIVEALPRNAMGKVLKKELLTWS